MKIIKLDTPNTSYICGIADGYLGHVYYGKRLRNGDTGYLLKTEEAPFVPSVREWDKVSFSDSFPFEYPVSGTGDFREACLSVRTQDGGRGAELKYESHRFYTGKKALNGLPATFGADCVCTDVTLSDPILGIRVILTFSAFQDLDVIARSVKIENTGESTVVLERALSASLEMDNEGYEMLTLSGSWARERYPQRRKLGFGGISAESVRGISSAQANPFMAIVSENCTQTEGRVWAMNFVYSGNFLAKTSLDQYNRLRVVMGIHPEGFEWMLAPGETFDAPEVILTYSDQGLGKMTRTFHDLYRKHLIRSPWKDKDRPVLINNWEATYFDFDSDKLIAIAKEAAACGIEMLVMDDGWFGRRNSEHMSLGDWTVNTEKLKGSLESLVSQINALGMEFGIWFEPEMISPDSDLFRAHPDWVLRLAGREPARARDQYVLDLSNPEAEEYVYQSVSAILRSANIKYVKWDMNRPLTDAGSAYLSAGHQGEIFHRHVLALYRLQERLLREFPDLLLENCCSGGGRFDPGMLYYSPQIWCSDDTDAVERLEIQEGTELVYPLSAIGAHVSACPNWATGRVTPIEMRAAVAMAGTFGYELDITKVSESEKEKIKAEIGFYHQYSRLIRNGDYYRIASFSENHKFDCWEIVSKDREEALVTWIEVLAEPNRRSRIIRIPGLNPDRNYLADGNVYSGDTLMYAGLPVQRKNRDFTAVIYEIKAV